MCTAYKNYTNILQTLQFRKRRKCTVALNMSAVSARLIALKGTKAYKRTAAASQWTQLSSPRLYSLMFLLFEEAGAKEADSSQRHVPRDNWGFHWTPIFSWVESRGTFYVSSNLEVARHSTLQSKDTNLEACRHLECIERGPATSSLERGKQTASFNLH